MTARLPLVLAAAVALALANVASAQVPAGATPAPAMPSASSKAPGPDKAQPTVHDDRDSIDAGMKWLALVDSDKAGAAWELSSQQLKSAVTRDKFVAAMREARRPLGKLAKRTAERFARAHQMPGAPDGDYAIIEYEATFAKGKLTEHLVWKLEDGDIWRVSGYNYR